MRKDSLRTENKLFTFPILLLERLNLLSFSGHYQRVFLTQSINVRHVFPLSIHETLRYLSPCKRTCGFTSHTEFNNFDDTKRSSSSEHCISKRVESIFNCSFENDFTFDSHHVADEMILSDNDVHRKSNGDDGATDKSDDDPFAFDEHFSIENEKEEVIWNQFSKEYITNLGNFFDEKHSTGKRKQTYASVQRRFDTVKDRNDIRRFRIYIGNNGTQVQKLHLIDSFVYEALNDAQDKLLSVHHIDLKRWALKKAKDFFDTTLTDSDQCLRQLKIRHHIDSQTTQQTGNWRVRQETWVCLSYASILFQMDMKYSSMCRSIRNLFNSSRRESDSVFGTLN